MDAIIRVPDVGPIDRSGASAPFQTARRDRDLRASFGQLRSLVERPIIAKSMADAAVPFFPQPRQPTA
jgi:hypothetical protein